MLLTMLWEEEVTGLDPRSTRDPSNGSTLWPQQPDAAPRLGPGMVPPWRPVRADDEMSVQESEMSRSLLSASFGK